MATQNNLAEQQDRQGLTHQALASVDTGQVIAHQAVLAWAESLVSDNPLPLPGSLNSVEELECGRNPVVRLSRTTLEDAKCCVAFRWRF